MIATRSSVEAERCAKLREREGQRRAVKFARNARLASACRPLVLGFLQTNQEAEK